MSLVKNRNFLQVVSYFLPHCTIYKKKTQLIIFFCQLDCSILQSIGDFFPVSRFILSFKILQVGLQSDEIASIYLMMFLKLDEIFIQGGKVKGFFTIQEYNDEILFDIQGQFPVKASNRTIPKDHTSALRLYSSFFSIQGAIQAGLPIKLQVVSPLVNNRLNPQSATLILPYLNRIFAGLMSLWIIPVFSAQTSAYRICQNIGISCSSFKVILSYSVPPQQYQQARYTSFLLLMIS